MKAQPLKQVEGGHVSCKPEEATHVMIDRPGPAGTAILPVTGDGWKWNGDCEKPTLKPSIRTTGTVPWTDEQIADHDAGKDVETTKFLCHSFVTDGQIRFLGDSTHEFSGKTVDLLDVEWEACSHGNIPYSITPF